MKILFTQSSITSGGSEHVMALLASKLAERGHEVEIALLLYNEYYYEVDSRVKIFCPANHTSTLSKSVERMLGNMPKGAEAKVNGMEGNWMADYPNIWISKEPHNTIEVGKWLRRHVRETKTDAVLAFTEGVYILTIAALVGVRTKVIASERIDPHYIPWKRKLLKKLVLPFADGMVVQTKYIQKCFKGRIGQRTFVIVNPVRDDALNSRDLTTPEGYQQKENVIVSFARLYHQKRQEIEIKAFARLKDKYPSWKMVIYGDGPERGRLEQLVKELAPDRVFLPGRSTNVIGILERAKIFCLSSDAEGMSNSMIEAVCVGLPIVSTHVSGTDELIHEGQNGFVTPRNDVETFTRALDALMGDEARMISFAHNSRKMAPTFNIDKITDEWENLLKKYASKLKNSKFAFVL